MKKIIMILGLGICFINAQAAEWCPGSKEASCPIKSEKGCTNACPKCDHKRCKECPKCSKCMSCDSIHANTGVCPLAE